MDNQFPLPGPVPLTPEPTELQPFSSPPSVTETTTTTTTVPGAPEEAAPPPPGYVPPAATVPPAAKSSPLRIIIPFVAILGVVALLGFVIFRVLSGRSSTPQPTSAAKTITLTYSGLWEPTAVMKPVIDAFEAKNPNIKIDYQLQAPQDYQDRVKNALESANSPDIVRLHTTWLPIFATNLLPAPPNTLSATEITTNFYPIVSKLLVAGNQVYGAPLTAESLGLFVNTAMLQQKQLQPPKTWEDLLTVAKAVKEADPLTGRITRAGVALGNTSNVEHWPDIVSMMLLQAGVSLTDINGPEVGVTLTYYTDFVSKHAVWDETMPPSIVAFANEKVAMIIAPSWRARDIKAINPSLSWQVVPVPQLPDVEPVNWATIWFEGVSKNSKYPVESWKFVSFLASAEAQQILFDAATLDRGFPQPPASKAVAETASRNPVIAPYISSLNTAKSFYTASLTQDSKTSLNSRLIKYLEDAVNGVTARQEIPKIIEALHNGFVQVLSQYGLVAAPTPTPTP
ncbi:MAG: MalE-like protein maltose/maltodextrin ABC transporter [Candidatus Collierbacteria bacterium GW2011_GWB1_44_6]|uniref:MalE-like protein maltose/maltodextrin ABC transporter n=2 Tax=Candidatus Collieribacteriota TaxID=1752725 RepID=A0A0G1LWR9_9BACT|nr:MAG: MalE-like protein maltose/maltodextrin ABC transporter [Candidatus Collierbacteria bacterium GW2011_GWC2_43_12]KKT73272.1 MAG: MalE-like protein maltose/maltodextrin ABC transporter [Candidatus Collierbacteria bacterium GW2011_GWB1_44_6]KKT83610.1 MAG: MalE-like protein maltose/maltodextrin ABC transporter [Microgenomates group bacterium GW2011_GWC1_44_9]